VFLRHGHTAGNESGEHVRMTGWTDVPLSPAGEEQARSLGVRMAAEPPAAALYSSPLRRARDTAEVVGRSIGLPVQLRDDLREIACGEADGLPLREVRARFAEVWLRHRRQDDPDARWPGGESYAEFRARVLLETAWISARHPGSSALVVTHAGVISQILGWVQGLPASRWGDWRPGNCSLTEIVWQPGRVELVRFDDRGAEPVQRANP
jgi:probable phosphoglycerate mutase